jgi:hypothetical protein
VEIIEIVLVWEYLPVVVMVRVMTMVAIIVQPN